MTDPDVDDPDLPLPVLFARWPGAVAVLRGHGMLCFGCPVTPFHTLSDACREHGLSEDILRGDLRALLDRTGG